MIDTRHEANNQASHLLQVLNIAVLHRTSREGSWPCQARQDRCRPSAQPRDNAAGCLRLLPAEGRANSSSVPRLHLRNRMQRPGPYLVTQSPAMGLIMPLLSTDSQRFSPHPFPEEQIPKVCPSAPTQTSLPSPPNQ